MTRTKDKSGAWRPPGQPPALSQAVARMWELQRFFSVPAPYLYRVPEELEPLVPPVRRHGILSVTPGCPP